LSERWKWRRKLEGKFQNENIIIGRGRVGDIFESRESLYSKILLIGFGSQNI
jgi:hypothetical protein